mgnify:CR=1 FL=1
MVHLLIYSIYIQFCFLISNNFCFEYCNLSLYLSVTPSFGLFIGLFDCLFVWFLFCQLPRFYCLFVFFSWGISISSIENVKRKKKIIFWKLLTQELELNFLFYWQHRGTERHKSQILQFCIWITADAKCFSFSCGSEFNNIICNCCLHRYLNHFDYLYINIKVRQTLIINKHRIYLETRKW